MTFSLVIPFCYFINMKWKSLVQLAKREYGLKKIVWRKGKNLNFLGECDFVTGTIHLNYKHCQSISLKDRAQLLFHELGHIYCFNNNIWSSYHTSKRLTRARKQKIIYTALKAEKWVDMWAEQQYALYYPNFKFERFYNNSQIVKAFREHFLTQFR